MASVQSQLRDTSCMTVVYGSAGACSTPEACLAMQVVRCALENASSVAKTFLMSDVVVTEIPQPEPVGAGAGMDSMGGY